MLFDLVTLSMHRVLADLENVGKFGIEIYVYRCRDHRVAAAAQIDSLAQGHFGQIDCAVDEYAAGSAGRIRDVA